MNILQSDDIQGGLTPPTLVFVQTKERAQELFKELLYDGVNSLHSILILYYYTFEVFIICTSEVYTLNMSKHISGPR